MAAFRLVSFCSLMRSNHRARKCYGSGCLGCAKDWEECENPACENFEDVTDFSPWMNVSQMNGEGWMEKRFSFKHTKPTTASKVSIGAIENMWGQTLGLAGSAFQHVLIIAAAN